MLQSSGGHRRGSWVPTGEDKGSPDRDWPKIKNHPGKQMKTMVAET